MRGTQILQGQFSKISYPQRTQPTHYHGDAFQIDAGSRSCVAALRMQPLHKVIKDVPEYRRGSPSEKRERAELD